MVMKNRPSSTSRNGAMSSSTWCLYSVSDTSMPATKAPSASDRPARSVIQAAPSVISSRFSMNSSCERRLTTIWNQPRISFCPRNSSSTSTITAFRPAHSSVGSRSRGLASAGTRISSGTSARSWNSRMPMMRRPCSLSSSSRSVSILETMAVDDMASAPPSANAACQLICIIGGSTSRGEPAEQHGHRDGQQHLRHAQAEHDAPHRRQLGQREFEADRKHQEHHAEFGQRVGGGVFLGQAERMRADQDADCEVAQHRRQMQHAEAPPRQARRSPAEAE